MKKTLVALAATATLIAATPTEYKVLPTITAEASETQSSFFDSYGPIASKVAGNNDLYASVMLAQMALESNFGRSGLSRPPVNNLFGIKGTYNGQSIAVATKEDDGNGNMYSIVANFRKYPSAEDSMLDYVKLLQKPIYSKAKKSATNSYKNATQALQGTYATDTAYASKLNSLIERFDLTQFDNGKNSITSQPSNGTPISDAQVEVMAEIEFQKYTVVSGDTLFKIGKKFGTSVDYIKSVNKLSSDTIYVGQVLKVKETNSSVPSTESVQAPAVQTAPSVQTISYQKHTIKSGDTLSKISKAYGVSIASIKGANNMSSDLIYVGKTLTIPVAKKTTEVQSTNWKAATKTYHKISSGDTLFKIATKYGTTVDSVKKLNGLTSDTIYVGKTIQVK